MLMLPPLDQIARATIYGDSDRSHVFYVLPEVPTITYGKDGRAVFQFVKFRSEPGGPSPAPDSGGGYVQFDCGLNAPASQLKQIRDVLQERVNESSGGSSGAAPPIEFGTPDWVTDTDTRVELQSFKQSQSGLVTETVASARPSMIGSNSASFSLLLSQLGATVLWDAFHTEPLLISLQYRLKVMARIPPLEMHVHLDANAVADRWTDINKAKAEGTPLRQTLEDRGAAGVDIVDWQLGDHPQSDSFKRQILAWGWSFIEAAMQSAYDAADDATDKNKVLPHLHDIDLLLRQDSVIPWSVNPQGMLQEFLDTAGPNGMKPRKDDLFQELSLGDPIFKRLEVRATCNADFEHDPIAAVKLGLEYGSQRQEFVFRDNASVENFRAVIRPDLGETYRYWTEVIFKGSSRKLRSQPVSSQQRQLVLNFPALGYLRIRLVAGDVDWSQVSQVQVDLRYADPAAGVVPFDETIVLTADSRETEFQRILWARLAKPYEYRARYALKGGQKIDRDWTESVAELLVIDDVFDRLVVPIQPVGGWSRISRITVAVKYEDPDRNYRLSNDFTFTPEKPGPATWVAAVPAGGPRSFKYRTILVRSDGTVTEGEWITQVGGGSVHPGESVAGYLEVEVIPDLLDFEVVKLARVALRYRDEANGVDETKNLVFSKDQRAAVVWKTPIKNKDLREYVWSATYFLADARRLETRETRTAESGVVLQLPR